MQGSGSRLSQFRAQQPAAWSLLKFAASQGLASIDRTRDRVLLTTELRRRHPEIYEVLGGAIAEWRRTTVAP